MMDNCYRYSEAFMNWTVKNFQQPKYLFGSNEYYKIKQETDNIYFK
jgi:hypothetical protein